MSVMIDSGHGWLRAGLAADEGAEEMRLNAIVAGTALAVSGLFAAPAMAGSAGGFDWSGAYVGASIGGGWGNVKTDGASFYNDPAGTNYAGGVPGVSFSNSGVIGGLETGYNWQQGGIVFGLQADISAAGLKGSFTDNDNGYAIDTNVNWLSTLRGQIGVPYGRYLFYATGGLAVGGIDADLHDRYPGPGTVDSSDSQTGVGYTVGAGVAAAINTRWIAKLEYQYVDLGKETFSFNEPTGGWPLIKSSAKTSDNLVRFSLDYRF
jgi:outer membrane immunogenic protein